VSALLCHPQTPSAAVQGIDAHASRAAEGRLAVTYRIRGALERLRVPPPRVPGPGEGLWQHTCCELFVARERDGAYEEFNFSPSGEWAGYGFRGYRDGGPAPVPDPLIRVRTAPGELEVHAFPAIGPGKLFAGLCAVIEERDGRLSYWALKHPPGRPDFHRAETFALELG
jgi:hypothetical protein